MNTLNEFIENFNLTMMSDRFTDEEKVQLYHSVDTTTYNTLEEFKEFYDEEDIFYQDMNLHSVLEPLDGLDDDDRIKHVLAHEYSIYYLPHDNIYVSLWW